MYDLFVCYFFSFFFVSLSVEWWCGGGVERGPGGGRLDVCDEEGGGGARGVARLSDAGRVRSIIALPPAAMCWHSCRPSGSPNGFCWLCVFTFFAFLFRSLPSSIDRCRRSFWWCTCTTPPLSVIVFFPFFSRLFGSRVAVQLAPLPIGWAVVDWSDWNYFFQFC